MPLRPIHILLGIATTALAAGVFLRSGATIELQVDGAWYSLSSHAGTVSAALREAGLEVQPEDYISPAPDTPLESGMTVTVSRATPVTVVDGERRIVILTRATSPWAVLGQAGVELQAGIGLTVNGLPWEASDTALDRPPRSIVVRPAVDFALVDDGVRRRLSSAAVTVGDALWQAGVQIYAGDEISPSADTLLSAGMEIALTRSRPVTIQADGAELRTRTHRTSVRDVLDDAGVALVGMDYTRPALDQPLPEGGRVEVVRVREQLISEQEPLPFDVAYLAMPELELDSLQVVQPGAYGVLGRRLRIRLENGAEVDRRIDAEWVAKPAEPKIIGYGTSIIVRSADTPDGPVEYWRELRMYATSYSASRAGTPRSAPWYGRTRTGKVLTVGMVAVDPTVIPLGTQLYVPGYGFASAEDTGSGVKGLWIDLGYDDWNYVSWHRYVTVYVRTPVPPAEQIRWVLPT